MIKKAVILAGGLGTRISEETSLKPKPMIEIGGRPIIWHIMKIYSNHGINDFIICAGYLGYLIKEYFSNYALHMSDVTFDMSTGQTIVHRAYGEPWKITVIDTGAETMTGGRLRRVREHIGDAPFCMTYGDGLANIDIGALMAFHLAHGAEATVTRVLPPGRFGALELEGDLVTGFQEKPMGDGGWINGGFFVLSPKVLDRIDGDSTIWEREPLEGLARDRQLRAYAHKDFWQPMDTLRDKRHLEELWDRGQAPWKLW
ncbi:glucose-1-phosphate cytidylyltransferase [Sphingobium sp. CECT 9361]|uniref:glucose-1-phosphate cytidylyltransferase n=1 Tax=Sphingobium sp. CECT 9361 TaxID=2845384 RepID=UPI001E433474|nr:glucose-1-phosphate cytidylyltransferase [Sphingobium sp. CECT 9361]CAH0356997.1 Glucose-1-phosphate cytidylyltransferase [Sphingobium sp. CECT 9361]